MRIPVSRGESGIPEGTYVELVQSLFATLMPTTIMGILFISAGYLITSECDDLVLRWLAIVGSILSFIRVAMLLASEQLAQADDLDLATALRAERSFAVSYLSFALILGLFGARAIDAASSELHMIVTALLTGYAAGVALGVSLRPKIAMPAVMLAICPSIVTAMLNGDRAHWMLGFVLAMFMVGGLGSMLARYRGESEKITMRRLFGSLARSDPLTGLCNRLGLAERFDLGVSSKPEHELIAVHCLDLDRFKFINDQYGHPTGDALLQAVGGRLQRLIGERDTAARLGGDEFALLQTGIHHADEAAYLAQEILRALSAPYRLPQRTVSIGVSLGSAVSHGCDDSLDNLLLRADQALYEEKAAGGSVLTKQPVPEIPYRENEQSERSVTEAC